MQMADAAVTPPSRLLDLFHPTQYAPIRHELLRCLNSVDLVRLCATSRGLKILVSEVWNINDRLSRFFDDPAAFRTALGRCEALISGSFALQFFERVTWLDSDLDIYVEDGEKADVLSEYLTQHARYSHRSSVEWTSYASQGLSMIDKSISLERDGHKVQLLCTKSLPILAVLTGFYTTAVQNIISWNKAFCIYPRLTTVRRVTVPTASLQDRHGEMHAKYSRRGWRMRPDIGDADPFPKEDLVRDLNIGDPDAEGYGMRRVGDCASWTIRLNTEGVIRPRQPDSVIEYSCFAVHVTPDLEESDDFWASQSQKYHWLVDAIPFKSHVLRHTYTWPPVMGYDEIGATMEKLTLAQLFKIPEADRLSRNDYPLDAEQTYKADIVKPEGWDYYDDVFMAMIDRDFDLPAPGSWRVSMDALEESETSSSDDGSASD